MCGSVYAEFEVAAQLQGMDPWLRLLKKGIG